MQSIEIRVSLHTDCSCSFFSVSPEKTVLPHQVMAYSLIKQDAANLYARMDEDLPPSSPATIRRDSHGRPSKQTDKGPSQESMVRLLPASAICPMVGLREGRRRPDSSVPKRSIPGLSRPRRSSCGCRLESRSSRTGVPMLPCRSHSEDDHETFTASSSHLVR